MASKDEKAERKRLKDEYLRAQQAASAAHMPLDRAQLESLLEYVDALDVHQVISGFCVFRTANRHTFGAIFHRDLLDPARREHQRQLLGDLVVAWLTAG